jgi:Protein of unknown function (DUF1269)/MalT-like TPR region
MVPGARALTWFEAGHLAEAADVARAADAEARRLGFSQHFFAVDHLRVLSGLALERRDFDTAEQLVEQVLSITEQRRPLFEFLALLDRARIWAARGQVRGALTTVGTARQVVTGASLALIARADEQEALLRLSLGDLRTPTYGRFWRFLFGLLFFIPVFGMAAGAGMGALMGKFAKTSIDKQFQGQVRGMLTPGTSALFLMLEKVTPDKAVEAMSKYGGTVLKTSLSKEDEKELQDALHGGQATA